MKKGVIFLLVLGILLISQLVQAQTYSGVDRLTDNVKLILSSGDDKVELALEIRENEIDSALENVDQGNEDAAIKNLERAQNKLQIVQDGISLETTEEVKTSVEEITNKINDKENLPEEFDKYVLEEEKTQLKAELTEKTYEYCTELAKGDFALMLKEEECNPDTAIPGLEEKLTELKDIQIKLFVKLMLEIRSCIDDPGTCNCEADTDIEQKTKCEKMVALAIKCEYKADETSCSELKAMEPKEGDSFAESFVPDFLMNLFREKSYMIGYDIEPSDGVPEECWDENTKPECEQYDDLKETNEDWDEYGNFIGKRPKNKEPTMQQSIPQCFGENNSFLEEKCGKITIVRNEEGLVNYLIENEINGILEGFENKSEQNTIDVNETEGLTIVTEGQNQVQNKAWEIKQEMNQIENQIALRTFAPGTEGTGESGPDIKTVVVEGGEGGSGDDGLKPEIKTELASGGHEENNVVVGGDGGGIAPGTSTSAPGDTIEEGIIDSFADGTTAEGTDTVDTWTATAVADGGTAAEGTSSDGTTAEGTDTVDTWTATAVAL